MVRELTGHKVNPANDLLLVEALDGPGPGGASHVYQITTPPPDVPGAPVPAKAWVLEFQNGPINEVGVNGLTHEALIAILIDRLEGFEAGPYANIFNAHALADLRSAQDALLTRTKERMARGVEGTHQQ